MSRKRTSSSETTMSRPVSSRGNTKITIIILPVLILFLPLGYSLAHTIFGGGPEEIRDFLERPDEKHQRCLELDGEYMLEMEPIDMRLHHMDLLKAIRDEALREGRRGKVQLSTCRECHPSREKFCDRCHDAVSLKPDCFGCHYYP